MAQQKLYRLIHLAGDALDKGVRDLEHRTEGLLAEAVLLVRREKCPDEILQERVRARLGRVACHPGSIEVHAADGEVTLSGPVLRGEAGEICRAVKRVRGVRGVESRLQEHDSSENIPGLQGRAQRPGDKPEILQENWAPGTRLVVGGLGLALMTRALRNPGLLNTITGVLGFGLLARSARHTRFTETLIDTVKPGPGQRAGWRESRVEQGMRTAGLGRMDVVGQSGVYPMSGPLPAGPAELRSQASWGQGERGAAGYDDHASSELTHTAGQMLGALEASHTVDLQTLLTPGEIPGVRWPSFFNELGRALNRPPVTVEVREGGKTRVEQRDVPLDSLGADLKDRESIITVGVGHNADDLVIHTIPARRVAVREAQQSKLLEIEANDGTATIVRFRNADLQPKRIVA
jgi:hypothetical protein